MAPPFIPLPSTAASYPPPIIVGPQAQGVQSYSLNFQRTTILTLTTHARELACLLDEDLDEACQQFGECGGE